jgi:prepilin-type N-terminal cleavage/methylation domain-containing protein
MRRRNDSEAGFTITEVLVAILLVSIGAMTTFSLLTTATRNTQRAEASQVALEYAEQELELLRSMESDELALTAAPQPSSNELSPNYRVPGDGTFALSRQPLGNYKDLVVEGDELYGGGEVEGGAVSPGPTPFTSGEVSGKVFRYIVWRNDDKCTEANCPGKQDYKQIVVAVKVDSVPSQASDRGYFEVQSNFIDPTDNSENDPVPGADGKVITAQQFFLTDTPCSPTGTTNRAEITGNHLLHNTLGICASGLQTGGTPGAPDAMVLGSPPDPDPEDPTNPPEYDYSNDGYLDTSPDTGTGVQIRKDDTNECHYTPTGTTNPESQVHRWVTDPMAEPFVMTGQATLQFFTKSLKDTTSGTGKACVYLFKRHEEGSVATDSLLTNVSGGFDNWTFVPDKNAPWPQEWEKVRLTMSFNGAPETIPANDRLGVALSVERAGTQAEALSFMYDHPNHPTRLEVETNTPLNAG